MKTLVSTALLALFLAACSANDESTSGSTNLSLVSTPDNEANDAPLRDEDSFSIPSSAQNLPPNVKTDREVSQTEVDSLEQQLALIIGFGDSQALFALQRINQRLFSGTLSDVERSCMIDPDAPIVVLDALCDPEYPVKDGLLSVAFAISQDAEQGREDNNASCRSSLMNGMSDQCQASQVHLSYTPLNLYYAFSGNGIEDPNILLTRKSDDLSCSATFDRTATLSLSQMTRRGLSISTRLRQRSR